MVPFLFRRQEASRPFDLMQLVHTRSAAPCVHHAARAAVGYQRRSSCVACSRCDPSRALATDLTHSRHQLGTDRHGARGRTPWRATGRAKSGEPTPAPQRGNPARPRSSPASRDAPTCRAAARQRLRRGRRRAPHLPRFLRAIGPLLDRLRIVPADLLDQHSLTRVCATPSDEVYNPSRPRASCRRRDHRAHRQFTALGARGSRRCGLVTRGAGLSTNSEIVGKAQETPQRETTAFTRALLRCGQGFYAIDHGQLPRSYGLYAVSGIRSITSPAAAGVRPRKVSHGVARSCGEPRAAAGQPGRGRDGVPGIT